MTGGAITATRAGADRAAGAGAGAGTGAPALGAGVPLGLWNLRSLYAAWMNSFKSFGWHPFCETGRGGALWAAGSKADGQHASAAIHGGSEDANSGGGRIRTVYCVCGDGIEGGG